MNSHETLEITQIKEQILEYARTDGGREEISNLSMIKGRLELNRELHREREALESTIKQSAPSFYGIADIVDSCVLASKGGTLDVLELVKVSRFGHGVESLKTYYKNRITTMEHLSDLFENLVSDPVLSKDINRSFSDDGEVYDQASPKLASIRKEMRSLESRIGRTISEFIRKNQDYLTDNFSTIRGDRTVVPVKTSEKNRFGGIIHNQSASGQTTFVEPQILIDLNNMRQSLIVDEHQEIVRLCREFSARLAKISQEYQLTYQTVSLLDSLYARASWAKDREGVVATLSDGTLILKQARHPLLDQETVVANNYEMIAPIRMILITGPNTGGKTVGLKTIGTCVYLTHCGIPVLCDEAVVPLVDEIYADIGDKQSIQQSLSTFSAHIQSLKLIIDKATKHSLVLLDELGVGTDPLEGESLAQAVLEEMHLRQTLTVATTHYNRLKIYAKQNPEILNASVEFNVENLMPTFKYIEGVAGQSYALDIASKLEVDPKIIKRATALKEETLSEQEVLIEELEQQILSQKQLNEELLGEREEVQKNSLALKKEMDTFNQKKESLLEEYDKKQRAKLNSIVKKAQEILSDVRTKEKSHEVLESITELKALEPTLQIEEEVYEERELKVGDMVRVVGTNQVGTITEIQKQQAMLDVRGLRMSVKLNSLRYHQPKEPKKKKRRSSVSVKASTPLSTEVNIIGQRVDEGMLEIRAYIDSSVLNKLKSGRIIHGHGTGALREATHQLLKNHPQVKDYRLGGENEGGVGATIVTFK